MATALRDLRSEAWRELMKHATASEVAQVLDGVRWQPGAHPRTQAGTLEAGALFRGHGRTVKPLGARLRAALALAPAGTAADAIRASVTSLEITGTASETLDVGPLAAFPALEWVCLRDAAALTAPEGLASVARVELWRVATLDLSRLAGPAASAVTAFSSEAVTGLDACPRTKVALHPAPASTDLRTARATVLALGAAAGAKSMGPVGGPRLERLSIAGAYEGNALEQVELGALPALGALDVASRALREVTGLEALTRLEDLTLSGAMSALPLLPPSLRTLKVTAPLEDARELARHPALRELWLHRLGPSAPRDVAGLEALARMTALERLGLCGQMPLEILGALPELPELRSLALEQQELERVPEIVRFAPNLEVLSLLNCRGFLEHDALKRLPKLRELYVHGSTLARFPAQIEPQLRARPGLVIHGA